MSAEAAESRCIVGSPQPSVRVLVTRTALEVRQGHGRIEGCDIPISSETVERIACESGAVQLAFDESGHPSISAASSGSIRDENGSRSSPRRAGACSGTAIGHPAGAKCITQNMENGITAGRTSLPGQIVNTPLRHLFRRQIRWQILASQRASVRNPSSARSTRAEPVIHRLVNGSSPSISDDREVLARPPSLLRSKGPGARYKAPRPTR